MLARRRRLLAIALCLATLVAQAAPPTPAAAPFVMGSVDPETNYVSTWYRLTYGEAFRRLGLRLQVATYPTQRIGTLLDQGAIDGEVARARIYGDAHPELVRVEESVFDVEFALFATSDTPNLKRLEDLAPSRPRIAYRRGVLFCEKVLAKLSPPAQLSDVTQVQQGLLMLMSGRADYFCDVDLAVQSALVAGEFKGVTTIRKVLVLEAAQLYPYLLRRHADLAPKLAAALREMKAEGLLERYRQEALQEALRR